MDAGSADILELAQHILNAHDVPPGVHHDVENPIPVTVRILWERDGLEEVDTVAVEWTSRLVRVWLSDRRWQPAAVWVPAEDVRRR